MAKWIALKNRGCHCPKRKRFPSKFNYNERKSRCEQSNLIWKRASCKKINEAIKVALFDGSNSGATWNQTERKRKSEIRGACRTAETKRRAIGIRENLKIDRRLT